ncbi:DsbA family oxidoreductase [Clostridium aminobutyricum]|uniref:DsbA family protein n=1 Tax=Clostridium aminobutyricum TaxID=33953 RepID=A0A939D6F5_CLOAM|nr:DsbA family protein [Clostridium aminobutyricum]MBN7772294.1 DsbA family protein [Clostridium aminobutyricum]
MSINIQFVSDYVCPFCYINKIFLEKACEGKDIHIEYLPYELTPETQKQVDVYRDPVRKANWQKTIAPIVRKLNLDMKLPPKVSPRPYTRLAHEGYYYALDHQKGSLYNDRLYKAYFAEESDIGDLQVLKQIAAQIGLNANDFETALIEGIYRSKLIGAKDSPVSAQVTTLPMIKIGDTVLHGGIHSKEYFETLLEKTQKTADEEVVTGAGCGVDSCTF